MTKSEATPRFAHEAWAPAALIALSLPILFYGLGSYSIVNADEGFYHYVARNMLETGNWFRLEFTGEHRIYDTFMNAPIQYWARAVTMSVFGDSLWTMRILSAGFALASVLLTFRLVSSLADRRAAFLAGLLQLTTYQFVYLHSARTGELEPVLCAVLTYAAFSFLRALETGRGFIGHHLALAVLLSLKLPLVLVPIAAELAYFALDRGARPRMRDWLRAAWILPLGLIWHAGQLVALGGEAWAALSKMGSQAAGEDAALGLPAAGIGSHLLFYTRALVFGSFPYALAYPVAIVALLFGAPNARVSRGARLLVLYAVALWTFFIFVGKALPWYVVPMYPFLSAILALWLDWLRVRRRFFTLVVPVATVVSLAAWVEVAAQNPVTLRAATPLRRLVAWREIGDWGTPMAVAVSFVALTTLLEIARRYSGLRFSHVVAGLLTVGLLGVGAIRVIAPLPHLAHVSEMERQRAALDESLAAGDVLTFPIPVREDGRMRVRYYFGDDFEIVRTRDPEDPAVRFLLMDHGKTPHDPPPLRRWQRERDGGVP